MDEITEQESAKAALLLFETLQTNGIKQATSIQAAGKLLVAMLSEAVSLPRGYEALDSLKERLRELKKEEEDGARS